MSTKTGANRQEPKPLTERKKTGNSQVTQSGKVVPHSQPTDKTQVSKVKTPPKGKKT